MECLLHASPVPVFLGLSHLSSWTVYHDRYDFSQPTWEETKALSRYFIFQGPLFLHGRIGI